MQSVAQPNSDTVGLSADDVNTVKIAEAGLDRDFGMTGDDYTVQLVLAPSCATAQIEVRWFNWADRVGNCDGELEPMPIPGVPQVQHYRVVPAVGSSRLTVSLDSLLDPFQSLEVRGLFRRIRQRRHLRLGCRCPVGSLLDSSPFLNCRRAAAEKVVGSRLARPSY